MYCFIDVLLPIDRVFRVVEEHCPGFTESVLYRDVLSPLDLERIFGLQVRPFLPSTFHLPFPSHPLYCQDGWMIMA
jgi:phytoene dehydrogenase-like protein